MLNYMIPLIESYFDGGLFTYFYRYIIPLAFLAAVPVIIRDLIRK